MCTQEKKKNNWTTKELLSYKRKWVDEGAQATRGDCCCGARRLHTCKYVPGRGLKQTWITCQSTKCNSLQNNKLLHINKQTLASLLQPIRNLWVTLKKSYCIIFSTFIIWRILRFLWQTYWWETLPWPAWVHSPSCRSNWLRVQVQPLSETGSC